MPRISAESKVVLATGGTLLIAILMLAGLAASDHRDIRAEFRSEAARLDARMLALESRMDARMLALESRMDARLLAMEERFEARFTRLEERSARVEERLDRIIELLAQDRASAAAAPDEAPVSTPRGESAPVMSSVTPVPGTDFVILASEPVPSTGWIGKSAD